jgi:hypothetical protein
MRHLFAAFMVVLITLLPSCRFLKEKGIIGKKARRLEMLKAQQDSIRVADSIRKSHDRLLAIETARLDSLRIADEEQQALQNARRYNIIVGSFITPEYARLYADEFRNRGYDVNILQMTGSRFELVSAESHNNFNKAVSRLKEFQDTVNFESWLYIIK